MAVKDAVAGGVERAVAILSEAPRRDAPFPHLVFEQVLPHGLFLQLRALDPVDSLRSSRPGEGAASREGIRRSLTVDRRTLADIATAAAPLADAFAILADPQVEAALLRRFDAELRAAFDGGHPAVTPVLGFFLDRSGYELLPHTDVPHKAVTMLIYLADDEDDPSLGTELFALRDPNVTIPPDIMTKRVPRHHFLPPTTVPYRPNCGLAFAPSHRTFHGVSEIRRPGTVRRALQFQLNVDGPTATRRRFVR